MSNLDADQRTAIRGELAGEVAIVTGGAAGLGREISLHLAAAGASVLALDVDEDGLSGTETISNGRGTTVRTLSCDVSDKGQVTQAFSFADQSMGPCTILVAAAGIALYTDFIAMDERDLDRVIDVNLKGALLCAQESMARMVHRGSGNIVFISSVQAGLSLRGCVAYAATKAGLIAAARTLSLEAGPNGIRVNTVSPGTIDTPMLARDLQGMNIDETEQFLERVRGANVLGRIGTSNEIAEAVAFLVSPRSSYITGIDLRVDAGFTALKSF